MYEPAAGVGVTTIKLKLPDGSTVQRRFRLDGPISDVYHFLGTLPQLLGLDWTLSGAVSARGRSTRRRRACAS
eukprot:scaffold16642_cov59-Phaeocystis_antarctica.AAC.3